jgi:hypothetical protein
VPSPRPERDKPFDVEPAERFAHRISTGAEREIVLPQSLVRAKLAIENHPPQLGEYSFDSILSG